MGTYTVKSKIPIIWLDTLAVIEIYKTNEEGKDNPRIKKLFELVKEKVYQGKLICPLGEQEEEIEEKVGEVIKQFTNLSLGITFLSNDEIKESQLVKAIKSYRRTKDIELTYLDAFYEDPVTYLQNKKQDFIFSIVLGRVFKFKSAIKQWQPTIKKQKMKSPIYHNVSPACDNF